MLPVSRAQFLLDIFQSNTQGPPDFDYYSEENFLGSGCIVFQSISSLNDASVCMV